MRTLDWIIQATMLAVTAVVAILGIFEHEYFVFVLIFQFIIGAYQMLTAFIVVAARAANKARWRHFKLAVLYLVLFLWGTTLERNVPASYQWLLWVFMTVPAWLLAIYYFIISTREKFVRRTHRGSFLPHINF